MSVTLQGIEYQITGSVNSKTISNIRRLRKELENLKSVMDSFKGSFSFNINTGGSFNFGKGQSSKSSSSGDNTASQPSIFNAPIVPDTNGLQAYQSAIEGVGSAIEDVGNIIDAEYVVVEKAEASTSSFFTNLSANVEKLSKKFKTALSPMGEFFRSIQRIAMYRMIRTALKEISEGFVEGTRNAYLWSKAGGDLGVFAGNMDALATSTLYMKNALGAMMTSILNAVIPGLNAMIDGFVEAINAVNQFIAVITGAGTWNKAIKYPISYGDAAGIATGKIKELKKSILGFDEINKLTKQSDSSGGSGKSSWDYSQMFEQTTQFSKWAEWMREHLELVRGLVLGIGSALLGWKIASMFTNSLKTIAGFMMTISGTVVYIHGWLDAWENGVDWDNLIEMLGGATTAVIGLYMWLGPVAAGIGAIVTGIGLLVVGLKDWITTGSLSNDTFWALEGGITGVGAGIALLIGPGGWVALLVAGIADAALAIYKNWDAIKEFAEDLWKRIKVVWLGIVTIISQCVESVVSVVSKAWDKLKQKTSDIFNGIKNTVKSIFTSFQYIHVPLPHFRVSGAMGWNGHGFSTPQISIDWYANGGFPEDGLFMANHNELVGQFSNGKTAVANNAQIVEGIRQGVKDANSDEVRLLREQNELLRGILAKEGTVEIPLGAITSALQRKNQRDGGTFVPVG